MLMLKNETKRTSNYRFPMHQKKNNNNKEIQRE